MLEEHKKGMGHFVHLAFELAKHTNGKFVKFHSALFPRTFGIVNRV
jgi:hypothetical protein